MPIEGSIEINGEAQQTAEDILGEVVISQELSTLKEVRSAFAGRLTSEKPAVGGEGGGVLICCLLDAGL